MFNFFNTAVKKYQDLDGKTFKTAFHSSSNAELLDVRTAGEFNAGTIKGARNIDVTSLQSALHTLDKNKDYFVFCRSGNRSGLACHIISEHGFKAYNLAGGIGAWPR